MRKATHDECPDCGEEWCHGYRVENGRKNCWIWKQLRLDKRGRLPRRKESVDDEYLLLLYLCNADTNSMGDDWNGYRDASDLSDEQLSAYRREDYGDMCPD